MTGPLKFEPGHLSLRDARRILEGTAFDLADGWSANVERGLRTVSDVVKSGRTVYGINTGFGLLARKSIPLDQLRDLQVRLVRSHQAGTGEPLDDDTVRLILALKANSLARGHSGVRPLIVERLVEMARVGLHPVIPSKGSVGASGDLAPLAHLSATLIGEGQIRCRGELLPAADALSRAGLEPVQLEAKEGLALLNGTQVSTALALRGLFGAEDAFCGALVAGAMSVEAMKGSDTPFDPRIHEIRGHRGQIDVARALRSLMAGSKIRESHVDCDRVQDPYSLRCQPQVMGACLDQLRQAASTLRIEANAVSDNPLVFPDEGEILSGGNFHAEPVAMAADQIAIALCEIGALSERRMALLVDPNMSGLPAFLVPEPGLNSGFMIAQVTAAALASENKTMAFPASVDSLPTSANQEDHVSMATHGARRLKDMAANTVGIVAIEMLGAAQGLDFHQPLETSAQLMPACRAIRDAVPAVADDRALSNDIEKARVIIAGRSGFHPVVEDLLPSATEG